MTRFRFAMEALPTGAATVAVIAVLFALVGVIGLCRVLVAVAF